LSNSGFEYNASFSADGKWIIFTSERDGSADIYRVHPDNRWRWSEVKACEVSKAAHKRGYGTLDEV
jgi:hypothetical protein